MSTGHALEQLFEPVFYHFEGGYWSTEWVDNSHLESYLISNIRLDKCNLNLHVQRILLDIHFARKQHLIGALQDLFIATGEQATAIKLNLLNRSQAILSKEEYTEFYNNIDKKADFKYYKSSYSFLN